MMSGENILVWERLSSYKETRWSMLKKDEHEKRRDGTWERMTVEAAMTTDHARWIEEE